MINSPPPKKKIGEKVKREGLKGGKGKKRKKTGKREFSQGGGGGGKNMVIQINIHPILKNVTD